VIKIYKKQQSSLPSLYLCNLKNVTELNTPGCWWTTGGVCSSHCGQPDSLQLAGSSVC